MSKEPEFTVSEVTAPLNKKEKKESWRSVIVLAILLVIVFFVTNFVLKPVTVLESSMEDSFHSGDLVLMYRWQYQPQRGDVVVIDEDNPYQKRLFKRLIALEGDHLQIIEGVVYINGTKLEEPYISLEKQDDTVNLELTVPKGEVFVMGDNRIGSGDSRSFGTLSENLLMGKVVFRLYPFHQMGLAPALIQN